MDLTLSIVATITLGLSMFTVAGLVGGTKGFTMRVPSGPDAMGIIVFFIFNLLGWILTLVAAWVAAGRGGFSWFVTPSAMACCLVLVITVPLGFLSVMGLGLSMERNLERRWLYGWLGAVLLPVYANLFVGLFAWGDPAWLGGSLVPRIAGIPLLIAAVGALVTAGVLWVREQGKAAARLAKAGDQEREQQERNRVEAIARDVAHKAELDAMPDDAPLAAFVTHLFIDKSDSHHGVALTRIGGLPDLAARFDRELENPDPLQREYLLNYFRVADSLDPALLDALRPTIARCFVSLARDLATARTTGQGDQVRHPYGMPLGLLLSAQRWPVPRFEDEARGLRAELARWETEPTTRAMARIDEYLAGQTISS